MAGFTGGGPNPNANKYGYNGQSYDTMGQAQAAQNPNPGSGAATSAGQQAVMGLQGAAPGGGGAAGGSGATYGGGGAGSSYSVDSSGKSSFTATPNLLPQQADLQRQQTQLEGQIAGGARTQQEGLGEKAFQSQFDLLKPYFGDGSSSTTTTGGGGPMLPTVQQDPGGAEDASRNAIFARAKDQAGSIGRSAMNSLNDVMGARGITGSGLAVNQSGGVIGEGARQLGDVNREQAISELANARAKASEQYQGNITQRGQDVATRGQNINSNSTTRQSMIGLLGRGITY